MTDLSSLAEMEHEDPEFVPDIVSVDARLSVKGPVSALQRLFERAAAVIPTREVIPGTSNALLEAVQTSSLGVSHLRITASDGEQTVSVVSDAVTVLMPGKVLVPAKRIHDILKLAPAQTATIEVVGSAARIRSSQAQWTVQTPVGDTLAVALDVGSIPTQPVPVEPFVNALSVARQAASPSSAWLGLTQLLIRNATITGCDGGRLHRASVPGVDGSMDTTLPVRAADELLKTLKRTESTHFEMGYDENHLVFRIDSDYVVAKRLRVPFPEIENLLLAPAFANTDTLTVNREELMNSIKRVRVNSDPDTAAVHLMLIPGKKNDQDEISWTLAVRARDRSGNASQEILECQWAGPAKTRTLVVNHHFLTAFLGAYSGVDVALRIGENTKTQPSSLFIEDPSVGFSGVVQQMLSSW